MDRSRLKSVLREFAAWVAAAFLILFVSRMSFTFVYSDQAAGGQRALQFFRGFQFDLATIPIFVLPAVLFSFLRGSNLIRALRVGLWIWYGLLVMILAASIFNFSVNAKHLGWEFFAYLGNFFHLFAGAFIQLPVPAFLFLLILPSSAVVGWFFTARQARSMHDSDSDKSREDERPFWKRAALVLATALFLFAFLFLALRGGFQKSPIRPGDAMRAGTAYLDNIPLNGLFTILHDSGDDTDFRQYYPADENRRFIRALLENGDPYLSEKYPLLRWMPERPGRAGRSPNVILVILESFTGKYLAPNGGDPRIAPNFSKLMREGQYFTRCSSTGGRSANGIFAMLTGVPDRAGRTILRSSQIQNRFGGLPHLLSRKGYGSFFVHGGDLAFDHLDTFLPHIGFEKALGHTAIEASGCCGKPDLWGYHDDAAFDTVLRLADGSHTPFFGAVFTQNTHHPYLLPDKSYEIFGPEVPRHDFLNAYHYTDAALGRFLARARKSAWFENTVFVFVADHADHAGLNYIEDRDIPLLVYAPGRIMPRQRTDVASQLDVLPTILGFAGGGLPYASTGRDLFREGGRKAFAFFAGGSETDVVGWAEEDVYFAKWLHGGEPGLARALPPLGPVNDPVRKNRLFNQTFHMQQFVRSLERENHIWPDEEELLLLLRTIR